MKTKRTKYKMRAECSSDLGRFLMNVTVFSFTADGLTIEGLAVPDMEATFTSNLSLSQLRSEIAKIEDGHVMLESLNYAEEYTGERYAFQ